MTQLSSWDCFDNWQQVNAEKAPANDIRRTYRMLRVGYAKSDQGIDQYYGRGCSGNPVESGQFPANIFSDNKTIHMNGSNLGFADGHAKFVQAARINIHLFGVGI
jgi:prepilin-type processing-associated H-X9-DG protein